MPYITRLLVENCRNVTHLDLDLSPRKTDPHPFCHLILTGPNGSGKSGVLEALYAAVESDAQTPPTLLRLPDLPGVTPLAMPPRTITWSDPKAYYEERRGGRWTGLFVDAFRRLSVAPVEGPRKISRVSVGPPALKEDLSGGFLQYLVNFKMEEALAGTDGDTQTVARIRRWFETFRGYVGFVVGEPGLRMDYERASFNFAFTRADGHRFYINQLSDGASSFLAILAELLLRIDELRKKLGDMTFEPAGVVLIDELEAHLHLRLQEAILPFLTGLFPKIQFIVATHSPAVIASIPGAIVHDLGSHETTRSEEFQGKTYGTLMTGHFGTTSDVDLDTTAKLARYRELSKLEPSERPAEIEIERKKLRGELLERSAELAVEVWMIDGSPPPEESRDQP